MIEAAGQPLEGEMDALVEAMAVMCGDFASMCNASVNDGHTPLGKCLQNELNYLPKKLDIAAVASLKRDSDRGAEALGSAQDLLAASMYAASRRKPVNLRPLSRTPLYAQEVQEALALANASEEEVEAMEVPMIVGDIAAIIESMLSFGLEQWLLECDAAMCALYDSGQTISPQGHSRLLSWIASTAKALARRCALNVPRSQSGALSLDGKPSDVERPAFNVERTADAEGLDVLLRVARDGLSASEEQQEYDLDRLRALTQTVPEELHTNYRAGSSFNLPLLHQTVHASDSGARAAMFHVWKERHGAHAAAEAYQALQRLNAIETPPDEALVDVVSPALERAPRGMGVPRAGYLPQLHTWSFQPRDVQEKAMESYDFEQRRLIRIVSMVWRMVRAGEFVPGWVSAEIAQRAAREALYECEEARRRVVQLRDMMRPGWQLTQFQVDMESIGSHLDSEVVQMFSPLSLFSQTRVVQFLGRMDSSRQQTLSVMARERAMGCLPESFRDFLPAIMRFALPLFISRRERAGLGPGQRSCALTELLLTSPRARRWTPLQGHLRLEHSDLRDAAPLLGLVLKTIAGDKGGLVRFTRNPRAGETKMSYVFDTPTLRRVLQKSGCALPASWCW